jgi:hypothetical protein
MMSFKSIDELISKHSCSFRKVDEGVFEFVRHTSVNNTDFYIKIIFYLAPDNQLIETFVIKYNVHWVIHAKTKNDIIEKIKRTIHFYKGIYAIDTIVVMLASLLDN